MLCGIPFVHPGRLTWNLQITHLERKIIFQTSVIMFHVNLQECIQLVLNFPAAYWIDPLCMCFLCLTGEGIEPQARCYTASGIAQWLFWGRVVLSNVIRFHREVDFWWKTADGSKGSFRLDGWYTWNPAPWKANIIRRISGNFGCP